MRRLGLAVGILLLVGACRDGSAPNAGPGATCPEGAYCVTGHGDLDGDGRVDEVTRYTIDGDGLDDGADWTAGVVVRLADGTERRHRFAPRADDDVIGYGDIVGIGPLDDVPGDEVVVTTMGGGGYAAARLLRWDGSEVVEVLDPGTGAPVNAGSGVGFRAGGGFRCPVVDGERRFETYGVAMAHEDDAVFSGDVTSYRWGEGRLVFVERRPLVITPDHELGNECPGFERWGGAAYPES